MQQITFVEILGGLPRVSPESVEGRIEWRRGELDPRPNLAKKASLRRVVNVIFKIGCEERRRNHSYPIPYLDVPSGIRDIDSTDHSAHPPAVETEGR